MIHPLVGCFINKIMKYDLSILIPARNEMFLSKTIENILEKIRGNTEIIAVLDGAWSDPGIKQDPRVTIIHYTESIGQRAATNQACRLSSAKYVMKVDAHCAFDEGFDVKMLEAFKETGDNVTMVPAMYNLWAFDWVCPDGHRRYQSPSGPCTECGKETTREIQWRIEAKEGETAYKNWKGGNSPRSTSYCFDKSLHFQYFSEYKKKQTEDLSETMSLQGSCFMLTREKYWELNICDEAHGSWGQQGVEVACKTWLSGGRVICNKRTWYAHMFRTQGGDFGFPYPNNGIEKARKYSQDLWLNNKWDKAIHPLSWLIEKFKPPHWDVSKGIVYYTDNQLDPVIEKKCQDQLRHASNQHRIVSVSLKKIDFGDNLTLPLERGYISMFKQILAGLEALDTDVAFLCEADVLYHPSHFDFIPPKNDVYYYNMNCWQLRWSDGHAVYYDRKQVSGLCANRKFLIQHYKERLRKIEEEGRFNYRMGFEPGTHNRPEKVDNFKAEGWRSDFPNIDIRHNNNLTKSRWHPSEFRNERSCRNWKEADEIESWGKTCDIIKG